MSRARSSASRARSARSRPGVFEVEIALGAATVGDDAGQLLNMLYGNSSLQEDVELIDFRLPEDLIAALSRPRAGDRGLARPRRRRGAGADLRRHQAAGSCRRRASPSWPRPSRSAASTSSRTITGSRTRPIRRSPSASPPIARACRRAAEKTGRLAGYVPSLSGALRAACASRSRLPARPALGAVLVAPMIAGLSNVQALAAENRDLLVFAHPTMGGAARIAPPALMRLFRLVGGDVGIFPELRRPLRLFPPDLPRAGERTARALGRPQVTPRRRRPAA